MNKLEEQIKKGKNDYCGISAFERGGFDGGAQFVLDLELPIKFAEWINEYFTNSADPEWIQYKGSYLYDEFYIDEVYEVKEVYKFWIENIYGR